MVAEPPQKSPFDPSLVDYDPETPSLDQVIGDALRSFGQRLRVSLPAKVVLVSGNGQVDVQPMLKTRYLAELVARDVPVIRDVPVCLPMGGKYGLKVPLSIGDQGMLIFCDRSLDAWSQATTSATVDPADSRQHHISDAVFVPGLYPFPQQDADVTDDTVVRSGKAALRLAQGGQIALQNTASGQELVSLVGAMLQNQIDLLNQLLTNTYTMTAIGPQPFLATTLASLAQLQATAQSVQTALKTLTYTKG